MAHKIWLLGVGIAVATVALSDSWVPNVCPVVMAIMVGEWSVVGRDACGDVCCVRLWLIASRVLIEQSPIIVSWSPTSGTQILWRVDTRVGR